MSVVREVKTKCLNCGKEIYLNSENSCCPYCNYLFTPENLDSILNTFNNQDPLENYSKVKTLKVSKPKKPSVDGSNSVAKDVGVLTRCETCGRLVKTSHNSPNCTFCGKTFTPEYLDNLIGSTTKVKPVEKTNSSSSVPNNTIQKKQESWFAFIIRHFLILFVLLLLWNVFAYFKDEYDVYVSERREETELEDAQNDRENSELANSVRIMSCIQLEVARIEGISNIDWPFFPESYEITEVAPNIYHATSTFSWQDVSHAFEIKIEVTDDYYRTIDYNLYR